MIRLKAIIKPVLFAGGLLLAVGTMLKAMTIVYRGPLANESALAYNKTYSLNTANTGVDYLSTQIVYSSASPSAVSFTDGTQSTGSISVTSVTNLDGKQCSNSLTVSTTASLTSSYFVIGGNTLTEGQQWYTQTSSNSVATSIKTAINTYAPQFTASIGAQTNKVSIVGRSSGTWCNTSGLTVSVSSMQVGAATFSGGIDNGAVAINNVILVQGRDWTKVATTTGTAKAISDAIMASTSLNTIIRSTWSLSIVGTSTYGVVNATSIVVGTDQNYALYSSSNALLSLSGTVTSDTQGRGYSAMTGGTASAVTLNSPIITKANTWTPNDPNATAMLALGVVLSTASNATPPSPLVYGATYYVIPISQSQFELSATSTGAVAGTYITLTSSSAQTTAHTFTLTPQTLAGTVTFAWTGSNDGTNWYTVGTSSAIPAAGYTNGGQSILTDWGAYNYSYLKLNVTAPTAGGINFKATANGRSTNR